MHDSWCVLDFFVVFSSLTKLILQNSLSVGDSVGNSGNSKKVLADGMADSGLVMFEILHALRCLRPLRAVSRNPGMKAVEVSVFKSAPAILEVLVVLVFFVVVFNIFDVQLFKYRLSSCSCTEWCPEKRFQPNGPHMDLLPEQCCQGTCDLAPPRQRDCQWNSHAHDSFDNVLYASLTLFEVSTLEMWPDIMCLVVDGTSAGEGPKYDKYPLAVHHFTSHIVTVAFLIMNLCVGIVIDKFTAVCDQTNGLSILSAAQRKWIRSQRALLQVGPQLLLLPRDDQWRLLCLQLISTSEFEWIAMGLMGVNVLTVCANHYDATPGVVPVHENANIVVLANFTPDAILKLYALRQKLNSINP